MAAMKPSTPSRRTVVGDIIETSTITVSARPPKANCRIT
jgi:hypothetical protein